MPTSEDKTTGLQFIRDFYRGTSAYADYINPELLSDIHLKTKLDDAILSSVKDGKDVVLTGNPGDGKTHIIRMLRNQLEQLPNEIVIELDASTLSNDEIYERWNRARQSKKPFVLAINAAVLFSAYNSHTTFEPLQDAYWQMSHAVVFHEIPDHDSDVVVFDLSKREALTRDILKQAIEKLTDGSHYYECEKCPLAENCVVAKNRKLLNNSLFQERLSIILQRVSLKGYHATLREVQSFIAYLIFGNRTCKEINDTAGNSQFDLVNLIYSGRGRLFDEIREAIDPVKVSHPKWDERILLNELEADSWIEGFEVPAEQIAFDNDMLFSLRKRQFFFFNKEGGEILQILDDDASRFQNFLEKEDSKIIKELILKLNNFFGMTKASRDKLQIWSGHRFNNDPRKVLISAGYIGKKDLQIGRPTLLQTMSEGIDMMPNYLRLEKADSPGIYLKINYDMYLLLNEAARGVPVLFMESDLVKKVWRFIEQLQSFSDIKNKDTVNIGLMDVQNKRTIHVTIDKDENKYASIESERSREV